MFCASAQHFHCSWSCLAMFCVYEHSTKHCFVGASAVLSFKGRFYARFVVMCDIVGVEIGNWNVSDLKLSFVAINHMETVSPDLAFIGLLLQGLLGGYLSLNHREDVSKIFL